ncbi:tRNA-intron endonuclease [Phytophthora cinnamomi]|uniref:tRNA-intron endonuclease n=1 Tax=Phytophthora cinnamomi TaxID=4785 RepID=UPI003559A563|nr:tRNA-intron endonuclease [Phytophthora cinnamomi]
MVAWLVQPRRNEVEVTFDGEDEAVWEQFRAKALGVGAVGNGKAGGIGTEEEEVQSGGDAASETKRRYLSLVEAYYAAAIDELLLADEPLRSLWSRFESSSATFTRHFAVYQHYRRLGWTPKPGLNYGAQFVLYRGSAAEFHSEYVVYVQDGDEAASWNTIQSLTRIAADVKKTVLLCTVAVGQTLNDSSVTAADRPPTDLTFGLYCFHDVQYTVEAVAIRFWDASIADSSQSYAFQPQPVLPKKKKTARKRNRAKRPKRQVEGEAVPPRPSDFL